MVKITGYRTYAVSIALVIIGAVGYIDPGLANYVGGQVGMSGTTILMICGLIMAGLRKLTAAETPK